MVQVSENAILLVIGLATLYAAGAEVKRLAAMRKSDHSESEFSGKLALGGQGVLSVENSFEYVGGFKGNKFNGYGVYTSARQPGREQVVKEGVWKDGNLVGTSTERRSK